MFRARLRQFPSLVTCCTIDWFNAWPEEALQAVATSFLNELADLEASPAAMTGLVRMLCVCACVCAWVCLKDNKPRIRVIDMAKPYLFFATLFSKLLTSTTKLSSYFRKKYSPVCNFSCVIWKVTEIPYNIDGYLIVRSRIVVTEID